MVIPLLLAFLVFGAGAFLFWTGIKLKRRQANPPADQ